MILPEEHCCLSKKKKKKPFFSFLNPSTGLLTSVVKNYASVKRVCLAAQRWNAAYFAGVVWWTEQTQEWMCSFALLLESWIFHRCFVCCSRMQGFLVSWTLGCLHYGLNLKENKRNSRLHCVVSSSDDARLAWGWGHTELINFCCYCFASR